MRDKNILCAEGKTDKDDGILPITHRKQCKPENSVQCLFGAERKDSP